MFSFIVDKALKDVETILGTTKHPVMAENADHLYEDKFLLAEFLTSTAMASYITALERIGLNKEALTTGMGWAQDESQAVTIDFDHWLSSQTSEYIIKEAAIIFEIKAESQYDKVILVTAPKDVRIGRVMQRDSAKKKDVEARIKNQLSDKEKMKMADFVISNIYLQETRKQVEQIHAFLTR